jgi:hydroxymethylglutaryl-CoA synthase
MVGIDSMAVYVPKLYLQIDQDWAQNRSSSPCDLLEKVHYGIGIEKMAIPDSYEDTITMAAMAVTKLIDEQNLDITKIGYIAFATETDVDHSKSCASYLIGILEEYYDKQLLEIGGVDFKFACISSSYALEAILALLESGRISKPYAILVTSDVAKYPLASPGEYTQGAGATALLIKENPRLMVFDNTPFVTLTRDGHDFFRPLAREFPMVDGKYSVEVYSTLIQMAFRVFNASGYREFDRYLFHVPFPKMAEQALFYMLYPYYSSKILNGLSKDELKETKKTFLQLPAIQSIVQKMGPSLRFAKVVGNIYTGSIFLALSGLIEYDKDLQDKKILFCAYGSGASSKVYCGSILPSYKEAVSSTLQGLNNRRKLTMAEYEMIHTGKISAPILPNLKSFKLARIDDNGLRHYQYC